MNDLITTFLRKLACSWEREGFLKLFEGTLETVLHVHVVYIVFGHYAAELGCSLLPLVNCVGFGGVIISFSDVNLRLKMCSSKLQSFADFEPYFVFMRKTNIFVGALFS